MFIPKLTNHFCQYIEVGEFKEIYKAMLKHFNDIKIAHLVGTCTDVKLAFLCSPFILLSAFIFILSDFHHNIFHRFLYIFLYFYLMFTYLSISYITHLFNNFSFIIVISISFYSSLYRFH